MDDGKPKLLDQLRQQIRVRNYSIRTEAVYAEWVKRYIRFHHYRHPAEMGAVEIEAFLTHLAVKRDVSASTQNQALAALLFLYKEVLKLDLPWLQGSYGRRNPSICRWCLPVVRSMPCWLNCRAIAGSLRICSMVLDCDCLRRCG